VPTILRPGSPAGAGRVAGQLAPVSSTIMSDQPASAPTKDTSRAGTGNGQYAEPPTAKRVPTERTHHGDTVIDQYAWLTDKDSPETIAFLEAENAYTEAVTAGRRRTADLRGREPA
jgi:Prolyl oligopeptidase, N-terminal beta-propeller domain